MHVGGIPVDLNWFLQLILTVFFIAFGLLYVVKNTASKYFEVDANFEGTDRNRTVMPSIPMEADDISCAVCGNPGDKKCSRCKSVRYCSSKCQRTHWQSGHKTKCKQQAKVNSKQTVSCELGSKASGAGSKAFSGIALVPSRGTSKVLRKPGKVLFPYDEFVKLFNWEKPGFPPCGLLNCGNSCFANVVLQCLSYTKPLVAFLLEKGHRRECTSDDWCFLCELQIHVEKASQSQNPFSPLSILSRLPNIGGNLGYGRQEDAHEFMRFAIDTMQSICLDEFGGEKAVHPSSQETTLIQHIFGGYLQSQVICTKCNNISNQYENMMDLTVEIHGDAASLEECLEQFTAKECLHGDNMYKCDGCNDYVKAWKRLAIRRAPNILTVALKRFQSGRFGKLNKRVSFPETLDLSPYMSEGGDGRDVYKLYAVVVHVDMLNASFFGHYICYIKDFHGNWYRIDDCKVASVGLEEVLSQGAYMLLYSRVSAHSTYLTITEPRQKEQQVERMDVEPSSNAIECSSDTESVGLISRSESLLSDHNSHLRVPNSEDEVSFVAESRAVTQHLGDNGFGKTSSNSHLTVPEISDHGKESSLDVDPHIVREDPEQMDNMASTSMSASDHKDLPNGNRKPVAAFNSETVVEYPEGSGSDTDSCVAIDSQAAMKVSEDTNMVNSESRSYVKANGKTDIGLAVFKGVDVDGGNRVSRAGILNGSS